MFLAHFSCCWCPLPFETGYLPLSLFIALLTFEVAIILILKHAAISRIPSSRDFIQLISRADSSFQKANIMSKIQGHFTASSNEYTIDQMVEFLMDTDIGMSILPSLRQLFTKFTDTWIQRMGVENMFLKKLLIVSLYQALCSTYWYLVKAIHLLWLWCQCPMLHVI